MDELDPDSPHRNVGLLFVERSMRFPDRTAVAIGNRRVSHRALAERTLQYAVKLRQRGVRPGARIALATRFPASTYCAMSAIALLGGTWLRSSSALVRPGLNISHIVLDTETGQLASDRRAVKITQDWNSLEGDFNDTFDSMPGHADPDHLAIIAESSGTTGAPKLIPMTYETRWRRVTRGGYGIPEPDPVISVHMFPVNAASSSSNDLRVLAAGGTTVHGGDYTFWTAEGVNQVTASPAHLISHVFTSPPPAEGEPRIQRLLLRGSKLSREFVERAFGYFDEVVNNYGATEVGGSMFRVLNRDTLDTDLEKLSIMPFAGVGIVDEDEKPVPAGTPGTVRVQSEMMGLGYLDNPEATAKVFRNGWFFPGDLGVENDDGSITLLGRALEQFNLGGAKISADRVDTTVGAVPGVAEAMSFVIRDDTGVDILAVLIVPTAGSNAADLTKAIVQACETRLDPVFAPSRIYTASTLPRNTNGKLLRREAAGTLDEYTRVL